MMRTSIGTVLLIALVGAAGCKGQTKYKPDPQTQADLDTCKKNLDAKDQLIKAEEEENARMMREQGSGAQIVVAIEGNALTVKPGAPGEVRPIDDKQAALASKEFLDVVARSRGAIQKCYEQALKNNTRLQAQTITLTVSASFGASGTYKDASFEPSLGNPFDACIKTVASKWSLPSNSPAMTFKAQVSLTPS
jgi:hypothetical protein